MKIEIVIYFFETAQVLLDSELKDRCNEMRWVNLLKQRKNSSTIFCNFAILTTLKIINKMNSIFIWKKTKSSRVCEAMPAIDLRKDWTLKSWFHQCLLGKGLTMNTQYWWYAKGKKFWNSLRRSTTKRDLLSFRIFF